MLNIIFLKFRNFYCKSIIAGLTLVISCSGQDATLTYFDLPSDALGEVNKYLSCRYQHTVLSLVCKDSLKMRNIREANIMARIESDPELFKSYQELPKNWQTPKVVLRLIEQANDICLSLHYVDKTSPLINFYSAYGFEKAIDLKGKGLSFEITVYSQDPTAAKIFIEEQVTKGNPEAVRLKAVSLDRGLYGYSQDPAAAKIFIEEQVTKGNPEAVRLKAVSLDRGLYEYSQDPAAANVIIEEHVTKDIPEAITLKAIGLAYGLYGYSQDPAAAKIFIEEQVTKGNPEAVRLKAEGITNGEFGFDKNYATAQTLLFEHYGLPALYNTQNIRNRKLHSSYLYR